MYLQYIWTVDLAFSNRPKGNEKKIIPKKFQITSIKCHFIFYRLHWIGSFSDGFETQGIIHIVYSTPSVDPIKSEPPKRYFIVRSEVSPLDDHGPNPTSYALKTGLNLYGQNHSIPPNWYTVGLKKIKIKWMHGTWYMVHSAWCMVYGVWCMRLSRCAVLVGMFLLSPLFPSRLSRWLAGVPVLNSESRQFQMFLRIYILYIVYLIVYWQYADHSYRWTWRISI